MRYMDYKRYQIKADQVTVCKWQGDAGEVMVFGREENIPYAGIFLFHALRVGFASGDDSTEYEYRKN